MTMTTTTAEVYVIEGGVLKVLFVRQVRRLSRRPTRAIRHGADAQPALGGRFFQYLAQVTTRVCVCVRVRVCVCV